MRLKLCSFHRYNRIAASFGQKKELRRVDGEAPALIVQAPPRGHPPGAVLPVVIAHAVADQSVPINAPDRLRSHPLSL